MRYQNIFIGILLFSYTVVSIPVVYAATERDQLKRIHDRIAGIHPDESILADMETAYTSGYTDNNGVIHPPGYQAAAYLALDHPGFYNITLKNMVSPWTNEAQSVFEPLNDYTATVIGMVRDDRDFREILSGDVLYTVGDGAKYPVVRGTPSILSGLSSNLISSNSHYSTAEQNGEDLKARLSSTTQSAALGIPSAATAGVMTTRAAAKAFFIDGTNRAMFRFTVLNHFCNDLEYFKDVTRSTDKVRQDVSRSPGGDSRIYLNNCVGCHSGMDPMAQAFAFYNYEYDPDADPNAESGVMAYKENFDPEPFTGDGHKYLINADNFKWGYVTTDASWINYWRQGPNSTIGWDTNNQGLIGAGVGAKSLGVELANSNAFATCQVKKVFKTVCLRNPVDNNDQVKIGSMTTSFKTGYNLKQSFAEAAEYCLITP